MQIKGFNRTSKAIIMQMKASGITSEYTKSISFEDLVVYLRDMSVVRTSKACLQRIHYLCTFRHGSVSRVCKPENVNVRVFHAAFMIVYRPTHVFEYMCPLAQALFDASEKMIKSFELICDALLNSTHKTFNDVPHELTKDFEALLVDFLVKFKAWKVPDEIKLTGRIKHALIALYQASS